MSVLPRNIVVDISTCRKNEFAQLLFRMFYGEYEGMSFDSQLYALGCNRVSESKIVFYKKAIFHICHSEDPLLLCLSNAKMPGVSTPGSGFRA